MVAAHGGPVARSTDGVRPVEDGVQPIRSLSKTGRWTRLFAALRNDPDDDDIGPATELVARVSSRRLLADKAYDAGHLRDALGKQGCVATIPSKRSRTGKFPYKELYKARSEIECTFNLLKRARRFATRYEKTLRNYAAVVAIGCARLWLRIGSATLRKPAPT